MKTLIPISVILAITLMTGCSTKQHVDPTVFNKISNEERTTETRSEVQAVAKENIDKDVSGSFYQTSVYAAVKTMAEQAGLKIDSSFVPSEKYRTTIDFNGSLKNFLKHIRATTTLDYRYRKGAVILMNRDEIEESISGKQCLIGDTPTVVMSFKDVAPTQIFKYFADTYNMTFVFRTKYYDFSQSHDISMPGALIPAKNASLQYRGCDPKEALRVFLAANNLVMEEVSQGSFNIMDYEVATVDVPLYFDYMFKSGSGVGTTTSGSTDSAVFAGESPKKDLANFIQKFLGPKGKVDVSNRGYVTIEDSPENIRVAKKLLTKEISKQRPLELDVSVIRIDVSDGSKVGINWDLLSGYLGNPLQSIGLSTDYATAMTGGGAMSLNGTSKTQLIKALEKFGNTKIVREYRTKTKSGLLNSFKAVDQIPYVTTTTTASSAGIQSNVEAKVAEAGLIINILPALDKTGETVDISANIVVSEYLGDKTFQTSTGIFSLPEISINEVKIPGKIAVGETMILTGFKVSKDSSSKEGLPGIVRIPNTLLSGLGGMSTVDNSESEFVIVITPKEIEEI